LKVILLASIKLYQKIFSPDHGLFRRANKGCRFYPSCSEYAKQAIEKHGTAWGSWLGAKRILRCHPWNKGGIDELEI
jgi:putative membrane protein insertion efficiency factor